MQQYLYNFAAPSQWVLNACVFARRWALQKLGPIYPLLCTALGLQTIVVICQFTINDKAKIRSTASERVTIGETEEGGQSGMHSLQRERHLTDKATFLVASLNEEECSNVATKLHCFRDAGNHHGWAQHKSALFQICRKVPWLVWGLGRNVLPHHWQIPFLVSHTLKVTTKCLKAFDQ